MSPTPCIHVVSCFPRIMLELFRLLWTCHVQFWVGLLFNPVVTHCHQAIRKLNETVWLPFGNFLLGKGFLQWLCSALDPVKTASWVESSRKPPEKSSHDRSLGRRHGSLSSPIRPLGGYQGASSHGDWFGGWQS